MTETKKDLTFQLVKQGDIKAYESLFQEHYESLVRYAYKMIRDEMVAQELAQEVFIYIWEKREQIVLTGPIKNYLFSATKNKSINWLRLELPKIQNSLDVEQVELINPEKTEGLSPEKIKTMVDKAVALLPNKCREIFVLSKFGGLTYDEIAEEMDLSKKTVENQMGIALKKLRESLKPLMK